MKKHQKIPVAINQKDEDFKVYILYPENAIADTGHKRQQKQNHNSETALKVKELHNSASANHLLF